MRYTSGNLGITLGLVGAPIGSCLIGSKEFIARGRWFRKIWGGGMRQTGYLAASAAFALSNNFPQLLRVHALAKKLEAGLEELGAIILSRAETCMVRFVLILSPQTCWRLSISPEDLLRSCTSGTRL